MRAIRRTFALQGEKTVAHLPAVLRRTCKAIHMVDAQAVDQAFGIEPKNRCMNRFEHLVVFDADGGKLIDIKEAPPVDFVIGRAPPHQPIVLAFEYFVQTLSSLPRNRIEVIVQSFLQRQRRFQRRAENDDQNT